MISFRVKILHGKCLKIKYLKNKYRVGICKKDYNYNKMKFELQG